VQDCSAQCDDVILKWTFKRKGRVGGEGWKVFVEWTTGQGEMEGYVIE